MPLLQVNTLPDVTVATLTARRLDESNAEAVGRELSALVARLGGQGLHLDLGAAELLTSVGLARLVWLHRQVGAGGGRLSLVNVRPEVYEVFAATRLNSLLDVHQAPEDAGPLSASA